MLFCCIAFKKAGFVSTPDSINQAFTESDQDIATFFVEYDRIESLKMFVPKRLRPLLPDLEEADHMLPSNVVLKYLDLFDSLTEMLQMLNSNDLICILSSLIATNVLKLFPAEFIENLRRYCNNTSVLLQALFPYTNWYDHSIVSELVAKCSCPEASKLLDDFDSRIDCTQSITAYPISGLSSNMIPDESSTHTILAIKCVQELSSLSLQHTKIIKSVILQTFNLTKQSCVLLAFANFDSAVIYWLLTKNVSFLISSTLQQHSDYLYKNGILEVAIYPSFIFSTGSNQRIWSIAYFSDVAALLKHVRMYD